MKLARERPSRCHNIPFERLEAPAAVVLFFGVQKIGIRAERLIDKRASRRERARSRIQEWFMQARSFAQWPKLTLDEKTWKHIEICMERR